MDRKLGSELFAEVTGKSGSGFRQSSIKIEGPGLLSFTEDTRWQLNSESRLPEGLANYKRFQLQETP